MTKGYFVTGTDTDVGKTIVSAWLVKKLNASYWKPVQSGIIDIEDKNTVKELAELDDAQIIPCVYELREPLSPHEAARIDGVEIDLDEIFLPEVSGPLIVEGAGGVLVPLNDQAMMTDLIKKLGLPTIVVARSTLGTINHTLMTLKTLRAEDIEIAGVILNGPLNSKNREAIETFGKTRVLAEIEPLDVLSCASLVEFDLNYSL